MAAGVAARFADDGGTVLVSSHALPEISHIADDVVVIHHGRLAETGPLGRLLARMGAGLRIRSPQAERLGTLLRARGVSVQGVDGDTVVTAEDVPDVIMALAVEHAVPIVELAPELKSLEDVFFELTSSDAPPPGR